MISVGNRRKTNLSSYKDMDIMAFMEMDVVYYKPSSFYINKVVWSDHSIPSYVNYQKKI